MYVLMYELDVFMPLFSSIFHADDLGGSLPAVSSVLIK